MLAFTAKGILDFRASLILTVTGLTLALVCLFDERLARIALCRTVSGTLKPFA